MFARIKYLAAATSQWLLTPVWYAKTMKRRMIFRVLRSRFFVIVAILTAAPVLVESVGATMKATHPVGGVNSVLLWAIAILSWVLFVITVVEAEWRISRRLKKK